VSNSWSAIRRKYEGARGGVRRERLAVGVADLDPGRSAVLTGLDHDLVAVGEDEDDRVAFGRCVVGGLAVPWSVRGNKARSIRVSVDRLFQFHRRDHPFGDQVERVAPLGF
jgi:hypothetical protein